ncbi:MAG: SUMF1/EgtB/PvdO family nonheme iron enzyme [Microcoleus sp. PH2017_29_MFU_D_A]|jgi:formylglycine-generating enzyme required for sulfatase activity/tRNA A-37 threonylcarbamoyl transferase component Bud32|uniref:bifunctional serine/threonine-protein kinase/formylglycine-generating enzyme family protein n=1 Tax=unclassified Microcoleus TaxID=2642155 RepID=UPI001E155FF4|nr:MULTISPECIES: bifunctional serine/threonine-protein kinase/formylglycine-generating enzyme family protein [unclassified Microcoleus]MCC3430063.1 SUMF1/EgtB/PvdO family nonheme iron enzyme [Microcoleus sp. PH2017_04_SCI_O_A]MCC3440601.1 SUMF1/EgtB/PvdO family nonheme iron enzyme [Microcoleus sp. PH2017_03_ELD_O_A]MCC3465583.1 SUMF1/EgtB/PvdO family nonheme iron enzyme [Microcoleus sp. PH2017_06_SFM_O_A]MCC3505926.1 SUMF1/EgtB/PvdO family nonheme iron enzyme [Microcoleus sp. PH2017_19_SFW_U_A]
MSQCLNPDCLHPNPPITQFCQKCGNKLLLGDRYRAVKYISEGAFGRTFKAVDEHRLDTICVIKQFLPQLQGNAAIQKATQLFKQEAVRLRDLGKHPQIPDLLAFFEQNKRFYLVQEFIDGEDLLKELEQQGKFSEKQIKQLLNELLPILDFVHNQKVIHRDIKPENIIRNSHGSLVLIDFGVAKELSGSVLTKVGTVTGTPGYAAPEQMQGHVFPASDLYSLGVTCIRLLTGCFLKEINGILFDELFDPMQMQWNWKNKTVHLNKDLAKILDKMILFPVGARYQSAGEVLQALDSISVLPNQILAPLPPAKPVHSSAAANKISAKFKPKASYFKSFTEDLENGVQLEMIGIPSGTFTMGAPDIEAESQYKEKPQHPVTIQPFLFGKYAIVQAQWKAVAKLPQIQYHLNPDPSKFKGNNLPVENVSWYEAVEFCARLSKHTGRNYRLPTEAEWEYACRAGTTAPFYFGETITTDIVNYNGNYSYNNSPKSQYREQTTDAGSFSPNAFGLYDMHGNVWEWCVDPWHGSYYGAPTDGSAWDEKCNDNRYQNSIELLVKSQNNKIARVLRGGSWLYHPRNCRSAFRFFNTPEFDYHDCGFRVVCVGV